MREKLTSSPRWSLKDQQSLGCLGSLKVKQCVALCPHPNTWVSFNCNHSSRLEALWKHICDTLCRLAPHNAGISPLAGLVVNILTYRHRKETTSRAFSWASITDWSNYHSFTYKQISQYTPTYLQLNNNDSR